MGAVNLSVAASWPSQASYARTGASAECTKPIGMADWLCSYSDVAQFLAQELGWRSRGSFRTGASRPEKTARMILAMGGAGLSFQPSRSFNLQPLTAVTIARRPSLADLCLVTT